MAILIAFGDAPDTRGGDFERYCAGRIADQLSGDYAVFAHLAIPTDRSNFYDYDIVVASGDGYEVLECKYLYPDVRVGEDYLKSGEGFDAGNVFSTLANKCRVLDFRLRKRPFEGAGIVEPAWRVIVPDESDIRFFHKPHQENRKVIRIGDYIKEVAGRAKPRGGPIHLLALRWQEYKTGYKIPDERREGWLGRFRVRKRLEAGPGLFAYQGIDEPPCKVDVHLLEIPFPSGVRGKDLEAYLEGAARAMASLRKLRHPLIQCVLGHFYTGSSLVQVSDWFGGMPLDQFCNVQTPSLDDKILIMSRVAEAMAYCHQRSVFHRNLHPSNIIIGGDFGDIQVTGFECLKDPKRSMTATPEELRSRDNRLSPPEEVAPEGSVNYRLYDVFQAGVLFFWILEDGRWPFDSTLDYVTGDGMLAFSDPSDDRSRGLITLVSQMLSRDPADRPDLFSRVLDVLQTLG